MDEVAALSRRPMEACKVCSRRALPFDDDGEDDRDDLMEYLGANSLPTLFSFQHAENC